MSFDWLNKFQKEQTKADNYAEKTLAAYKLGMKSKGSIAGVRVAISGQCCQAARELDLDAVHHPDDAPRVPLETCDRAATCQCVYRPVMTYEIEVEGKDAEAQTREEE